MTQSIPAGPPISLANFGYDFWSFCKVCEAANLLNRFRSYPAVTRTAGQRGFNRTLVRLESEERRDGFGLVADRICERCNSTVNQAGPELLRRTGGVKVGDDLQLVAQPHRRLVFYGHS